MELFPSILSKSKSFFEAILPRFPSAKPSQEDSAALFHQHDIQLHGVFDTQVAYAQLEYAAGRPKYQISASELIQIFGLK